MQEGENSTKQQEERGAATEQGQQQGNMQTKTAAPSTRQQGTTNTGSKDAPSTSKQTQKTDTDSKESKQGAVGVKSGIKEGKPEQKEKTPWSTSAKMHTIALLQASKHDSTRFYQDYNSVAEAIEGVLGHTAWHNHVVLCSTLLQCVSPSTHSHTHTDAPHTAWVHSMASAPNFCGHALHTVGLLRMYEMRLKELNPGAKSVTYDYNSLCQYIDDMVSRLPVVRHGAGRYLPLPHLEPS